LFADLDWLLMQEAAQEPDEDTAELGMAANSILQSIPRHVLKALEQQQVEANAVNAESKVNIYQLVITFPLWRGASHAETFSFCCLFHTLCAKLCIARLFSNLWSKLVVQQHSSKKYLHLSEKLKDPPVFLKTSCCPLCAGLGAQAQCVHR